MITVHFVYFLCEFDLMATLQALLSCLVSYHCTPIVLFIRAILFWANKIN